MRLGLEFWAEMMPNERYETLELYGMFGGTVRSPITLKINQFKMVNSYK